MARGGSTLSIPFIGFVTGIACGVASKCIGVVLSIPFIGFLWQHLPRHWLCGHYLSIPFIGFSESMGIQKHPLHLLLCLSIPFIGFLRSAEAEILNRGLLSIPFIGFRYPEYGKAREFDVGIAFNSIYWILGIEDKVIGRCFEFKTFNSIYWIPLASSSRTT